MATDADREQGEIFDASLSTMSLTELQDVFGHLDRDKYPDRIEAVRHQMHARIEQLSVQTEPFESSRELAGVFRRLWGSILDVFVSLFPLVLYLGAQMLSASGGGGGRGGRGGRGGGRGRGGGQAPEESVIDQILDYVTSPEAVWGTVEAYGPYVLGFMIYRALYALPQLVRSGSLPGMREAGIRVTPVTGEDLTYKQAAIRHFSAYFLGFLTLGLGHVWAIWDGQRRTLYDRIAGTQVVRLARRWEKPAEQRILED